ncbi:MAG TPA: sigma-70 family RNA polymerase sigma factor [Microvirga sp.]|nr:sigma-70 family RNA polymerase sigma factor [Microvirga sp.]
MSVHGIFFVCTQPSETFANETAGRHGSNMKQHEGTEDRLSGLMRAAQGGDGAAYASLLRELTPRLRARIRRQLRVLKPEDVEDLVQDVLLSLHAVRATYDPQRPFLPWLFGIVHNRVADGARRYARRAVHEVAVEQVPVTFSGETTNRDEEFGDPEALAQAIRTLPPGQREAIEMLKLRELSLKEASAVSGMSITALKVAVHRAVKALRRALAAET